MALGLEGARRTFVEGKFVDTVIGIPGTRAEIVMLKAPDAGTGLELSSFVRPESVPSSPAAMANEQGLQNVAFEVDDLQAAVDQAAAEDYGFGRWYRRVRGGLADNSCPRAGGDPRVAGPAHERRLLDTMVIYSMSRVGSRLHH